MLATCWWATTSRSACTASTARLAISCNELQTARRPHTHTHTHTHTHSHMLIHQSMGTVPWGSSTRRQVAPHERSSTYVSALLSWPEPPPAASVGGSETGWLATRRRFLPPLAGDAAAWKLPGLGCVSFLGRSSEVVTLQSSRCWWHALPCWQPGVRAWLGGILDMVWVGELQRKEGCGVDSRGLRLESVAICAIHEIVYSRRSAQCSGWPAATLGHVGGHQVEVAESLINLADWPGACQGGVVSSLTTIELGPAAWQQASTDWGLKHGTASNPHLKWSPAGQTLAVTPLDDAACFGSLAAVPAHQAPPHGYLEFACMP